MADLSYEERKRLRRAAEDARDACNRHYGPFIDVVAHPLDILALLDMADKAAQPDPAMAGEASEYERGRKDGWAAGWDQAQAQTDPAMAGDEGMPPLDDRASYSAAHIRKLIRADRSRQCAQPASGTPEHPVGAGDGANTDAAGCCGATVVRRCENCPHDKPASGEDPNA